MRPINSRYFGSGSGKIQIRYHNGISIVDGYIVRQTGTRRYIVTTDGVTTQTVNLVRSADEAQALSGDRATIVATNADGNPLFVTKLTASFANTADGQQIRWSSAGSPGANKVLLNTIGSGPALGPSFAAFTAGTSNPIAITGLGTGETVASVSAGFTVSGDTVVPSGSLAAGAISATIVTNIGRRLTISVTVQPGPIVATSGLFGVTGNSMIGNGSAVVGVGSDAHPPVPGESGNVFNGSTFARAYPEQIARHSLQRAYSSTILNYGLGGDTVSPSNRGAGNSTRITPFINALKAAGAGWALCHAVGNEIDSTRLADGLVYTAATILADLDNLIVKPLRDAGLVVVLSCPTPRGGVDGPSNGLTGASLQTLKDVRAGFMARHNPGAGIYVFDPVTMATGLCGDLNTLIYAPGMSPDGLHVHAVGMALMGKAFAAWAVQQGFLPPTPASLAVPGTTAVAGAIAGNPNMTDSNADGIPDGWVVGTVPSGLTAVHSISADPEVAGQFYWDIVLTGTPPANNPATTVTLSILTLSRTTASIPTAAGRKWSTLAKVRVDAVNGATDHGLAAVGLNCRQDFNSGSVTDYVPVAGLPRIDAAANPPSKDRILDGTNVVVMTEPFATLPSDYGTLNSIVERFNVYAFSGVAVNARIRIRGVDTRENRL